MEKKHVLVTTKHRGVFYGVLEDDLGDVVVLSSARNAIRWGTTGGFLELAQRGPNTKSQIGDQVPQLTLRDVTSWAECSADAVEAWSKC